MNLQRTLNVPVFLFIEKGLLPRIDDLLQAHNLIFHRPVVLSGPSATRKMGDLVSGELGRDQFRAIVSEASDASVQTVVRTVSEAQGDVLIGVGGGRVLDVGKMAAQLARVPFIAVPTTLSSDGIASPISVLWREGQKESVGSQMPLGVLIDIDIVRDGPAESMRAGVGDLLSNVSAIADWELASERRGEQIDSFALLLARVAYETFLQSVPSVSVRQDPWQREELVGRLAEGLVLSGLAMAIAGSSRPGSGAEHLISHALDRLLPTPRPHGLQVGVATLIVQRARGRPVDALQRAFADLGLPVTIGDLGIDHATFSAALKLAPSMRPGRVTLFDEVEIGVFQDAAKE
jgi:glycerol-1-phosphate dehydrogenase [NAD(P)+]